MHDFEMTARGANHGLMRAQHDTQRRPALEDVGNSILKVLLLHDVIDFIQKQQDPTALGWPILAPRLAKLDKALQLVKELLLGNSKRVLLEPLQVVSRQWVKAMAD
mmetsp:Transcript_36040/g.65356  ORF Transcript_36040/g.65356 Transcript_36040/m.65356 type:complete len:106 (-) Transcript_36040:1436-1753(-)